MKASYRRAAVWSLILVVLHLPSTGWAQERDYVTDFSNVMTVAKVLDVDPETFAIYANVEMKNMRTDGRGKVLVDYPVGPAEACRVAAATVVVAFVDSGQERVNVDVTCLNYRLEIKFRDGVLHLIQRRRSNGKVVYGYPK